MSGIDNNIAPNDHRVDSLDRVKRSVENLMQSLVASLPQGIASLSVEANAAFRGGVMFIITPSNPSAARILLNLSDESDDISLCLGRGAIFEVPPEGHRYSDLNSLDEIRALCLAAIRGNFVETVSFKGTEVVGARGKARIGNAEVGDTWRKVFTNPLRPTRKETFTYRPYEGDA
jgi:hypothetical protein